MAVANEGRTGRRPVLLPASADRSLTSSSAGCRPRLSGIIEASGIIGLYLDDQLRIRLFVGAVGEFFNLLPGDVGRDLRHFKAVAPDESLYADIDDVRRCAEARERQVTLGNGDAFLRRVSPYFDAQDRFAGFVLTYHKTTWLNDRIAKLTRSERRWQDILCALPHMMWTTDAQGSFEYLSEQWREFGVAIVPPALESMLAVIHPDEVDDFRTQWRRAVASGHPFEADFRLRNRQGQYRWFRAQARRSIALGDAVERWVGSFADVDSIKMSEQAVAYSRERIEALYDSAPVSLLVFDLHDVANRLDRLRAKGIEDIAAHLAADPAEAERLRSAVLLTDCNEWAVAMFGFGSRTDVLDHLAVLRGRGELDQIFDHAIQAWSSGESTYRTEWSVLKADGTPVHSLLTMRFPTQPTDKDLALISLIDINERKAIEDRLRSSDLRQRTLIEAITDSGLSLQVIDNHGEVRYSNRRPGALKAQAITDEVLELGDADDLRRVALEGRTVRGRVESLDGRSYDVVAVPYRDVDGSLCRLELMRDDSAIRLAAEQQRIAATTFESQDAMIVMDSRGHILRANRAFTQLFGHAADAVVGSDLDFLYADVHDETWQQEMRDALRRDGHWSGELTCVRKSGSTFPSWHRITSVRDEAGKVTHFVGAYADISDRKAHEESVRKMAFFDALTNLPNRRLLLDRLAHRLAASKRHDSFGALLFLDLDHFKALNDNFGHDMGDRLLVEVARRLRHCVREVDTIARFGGDEFLVIIDELSRDSAQAAAQAESVAEKIKRELGRPFPFIGADQDVGVSIGICLFLGDETSVDTLLKQADLALYQAKEAGRDSIRFYNPVLQAQIDARAELDFHLRHAIGRGELLLFFQAQISRGGKLMGAEALVRWRHPERGLTLPGNFIGHAEDTGLILPIGRWVLETACQQLATWSRYAITRQLKLSVNISPRQFRQLDFVDQLRRILDDTGANPNLISLELTESVLIDNVEDAIKRMRALKSIGVGFSIDDFGTGYSSLSYLKRLPVDQLKIDKSFVRDIVSDPDDAAIVKAIIGMGRSLDLMVFAEGVETGAQYDFLERNGCDAFQGFYFGRPVIGTNELLACAMP